MSSPPIATQAILRVKTFPLVDDAVLRGVEYGVMRAYKHTDSPTREQIVNEVHRAVISNLCDLFDFGDV